MEKRHLDFYVACMNDSGRLPKIDYYQYDGLCDCAVGDLIDDNLLDLFIPTTDDYVNLQQENCSTVYWADGLPNTTPTAHFERTEILTPLRQTILLFMAAINDEL